MQDTSAFLSEVNRLLIEQYGITFEDTGYEKADWLARFGDLGSVDECVSVYAEKYNLEPIRVGFY